ncbi:MAG: thiol-disulfide isomerase, partial [Acidobacteriota bacterium]|nr:thiol-disulfide isomerase [Acidobacteriota bacterium]
PGNGKDFNNTSGAGSEILMIYTPGMVPEIWRPGLAKLIKAGSDIVLQIHYTPNGKTATQDESKVGLVFAKEPPAERAVTLGASNLGFKIPPGEANYVVEGKSPLPNGATILSFFPHMHLRGKSFEYKALYPTGETETLLRVPKYDFVWQLDYKLAKPLVVPPGTRIVAAGTFDNSPNNPNNPDPKATVGFGEQSWEEMMIGFYDVVMPANMSLREFFAPKPAAPSKGE